jgi:hypothetical protein
MKLSRHKLRIGAADELLIVNPDAASTGLSLDKMADQLAHHQVARMKDVGLIYTQTYSTDNRVDNHSPFGLRGCVCWVSTTG